MSHTPDTATIHAIFDGLLTSQQVEAAEMYQSFKPQLDERTIGDPDGFYYALIYPHEQFLSGLIQAVFQVDSNDLNFMFSQSQFIDHHLTKLFERLEGRVCCADKASACMSILTHFFRTGQVAEFNYEGQYTYHLPTTILRTHQDRIAFFKALKNLYYGRPDEYLQQLQAFAPSAHPST